MVSLYKTDNKGRHTMREQKKYNPIAKDLRTPKYAKRIEVNKKGKGSYKRKPKFQE